MRRVAAAKSLIVGPDMLLRLERRGLIHPLRDLNGHRRYTEEDLVRLRQIIYSKRGVTDSSDDAAEAAAS